MEKLVSDPKRKAKYTPMSELTSSDYKNFISAHNEILIEDVKIPIGERWKVKRLQPEKFELETNTVWSFPKRGDWATHKGNYRGNWPPQLARNIILRYTKQGERVLDQMAGSGTTLIECKLLGRNGTGVDINPDAIMLTKDRLNFSYETIDSSIPKTEQKTWVGDARNLDKIENESVHLIATHPPYASIIPYSKERVKGDLSSVHDVKEFVEQMKIVAEESYRVLKHGRYCALLVGDTRRNKHFVPIAYRVMQAFLEEGFILKEDIIKHQWQCKTTPFWAEKSKKFNFLLLMHEHLFVFRKPEKDEKVSGFKESAKWW